MQESGFKVVNIDAVVIAERPYLKDFMKEMQFHIAFELAIDETAVNVKATTNEGLGAIGRKEGVAAQAVALISK